MLSNNQSLASRTLRVTVLRIGLVAAFASAVSYFFNESSIENSVRKQLILSTEQTLQRESLPFKEIKDLQRNFLEDFKALYMEPGQKQKLARDFDQIFYRHADGSYTQRPGVFEGQALSDGRRFANMSATYAPEIIPDADIKARLVLSFLLSQKYGSSTKSRMFNFYGIVPEKGVAVYQAKDFSKSVTYSGADAFKFESYEFYYRTFDTPKSDSIFTRMYWDVSNKTWMTTIATPDTADASGKHRIAAYVDVLLDDLMQRATRPAIQGARSSIFLADADGTLIFLRDHTDAIMSSEGNASIKSLKLENDYPFLENTRALAPGKVALAETDDDLVAYGLIPETPWVLAIHYPKSLMQPAIIENLAIVVALGLLTLLVEVFVIRSILQNQVAAPLSRLIVAIRSLGKPGERLNKENLPTQSKDEVGELARDFLRMAERVQETQLHLEIVVKQRTAELAEAQQKLSSLNAERSAVSVRRRFDDER